MPRRGQEVGRIMKYYIGKHDYGICFWYGDIEDDFGQFNVRHGQWMFMINSDSNNMFFETDKQELELVSYELPEGYGDSENEVKRYNSFSSALKVFIDYLDKYHKDIYDIIRTLFGGK